MALNLLKNPPQPTREPWIYSRRHLLFTCENSFHFNVVSDIPFLGSQWNTLNLSNYESPSNPLMSAPFEPNSITIIKMKGTEAIFPLCSLPHPKQCTAYHTVCRATPPTETYEMPKSKYYFLQMVSYFHSRHNCAELRRYTLAWRHHLKCPICLLLSNAPQACSRSPSSLCLPLLSDTDRDLSATLAFASHTEASDYIKECLRANVRAFGRMNQLVGFNRREDFSYLQFCLKPIELGATLMSQHFFFLFSIISKSHVII